ncbi:MAG: magnesium/cobalt transporter CorA [Candidatus Gracilibacteria bacterium]|nr:magnesium/cobalt transporter CorA [Candidatus Gracilibacteria bacterium]
MTIEEKPCITEKIKSPGNKFTWVSINNPDAKVMGYLKKHYKFHELDLEDCMSEIQRAKIDEYDDYLFIVLHIPITSKKGKHIKNAEIDLFVGQNFIITLHEDNDTVAQIFKRCKKSQKAKEEYMGKGTGYFLYMIIDDLFESCFPLLDDLGKQLNAVEKDVFELDYSRDCLKEVLWLKKDIINFRRIVMPQRPILAQLEHKNKKFLPENLDVYFDDIVDKIEKMWNMLENLQELVASLHETNESIISHNTNNIIKMLTMFSVVLLPMTFFTGFYGMNVKGLPFADNDFATLIMALIIAGVASAMIGYFRYKKWM